MKDLKISKELLSEVLNYEVDAFLGINKNEIDYTCCRDENEGYIDISINLYEFAFKCKEWAYKNSKVNMITVDRDKDSEEYYDVSVLWGECFDDYVMHYFKDKNEIVAIVKACNWILGVKNDK